MTRTGIGHFVSEEARAKFLAAYDQAMELWPSPRRELDVETTYGTVHVHHYGPRSGEPIVLLHGHAGHPSNWYPQIAALGGATRSTRSTPSTTPAAASNAPSQPAPRRTRPGSARSSPASDWNGSTWSACPTAAG